MIARTLYSRRSVLANTITGVTAFLAAPTSTFFSSLGKVESQSDYRALAAFCSNLSYPETVGRVCLDALPEMTRSKEHLATLILKGIGPAPFELQSKRGLAGQIRERSQDDFRASKVVTVDGWVLSLTETRVYALAALMSQPSKSSVL